MGLVFFWMNSGSPSERRNKLSYVGVSNYDEKYCDLSAVLAWMDLDHRGMDPRLQCPICPCFPSPMNYGAGTLWLGRLGLYRITAKGVVWAGPLLIACFLVALAYILTDAGVWQTLYCALLLFSPPVFLALERGNLDIFVFSLLVLAVVLDYRLGNAWGYSLVFAAGALKYYPFVAAIGFLRSTRRGWAYFGALVGAMALFAYTTRDYLAVAQKPEVGRYGWGYSATFSALPELLKGHKIAMGRWTNGQMLLPVLICAILMVAMGWKWRDRLLAFLGPHSAPRILFMIGSVLYVACFVVSGNFEYRTIFILLLVPQLLLMLEQMDSRRVALSGLVLLLPIFTLSRFRGNDWLFIGQHVSYWLLFCFCGTLLFVAAYAMLFEGRVWTAPAMVEETSTNSRVRWLQFLAACVLLAVGFSLGWVSSRYSARPAAGNLIDNPEFSLSTSPVDRWTLGTTMASCTPATWDKTLGNPGEAIILNSCGEKTSNPFAAQRVNNLIPGRTYVLTFDWAKYAEPGGSGAGTGKSFAVFVDLSGAPPSSLSDRADTQPIFIGERLNETFDTSPPITFIATGKSATIYFEAELDDRTPGGPNQTTDVAYIIDNIDLRMKPPGRD